MARRGRSASPARSRVAPPPPPSRVPARAAPNVPAPVAAPPSAMGVPQQPSMLAGMAQMAGGIAAGHLIVDGVHSLIGGSGEKQAVAPAAEQLQQSASYAANEPQGACAWEIKQFLQCANNQTDLSLCEGFNEALRQCKQANAKPNF